MNRWPRPDRNRAVFAFAGLLIGVYYLWGARAAGYPFSRDKDQNGYYNYLGRGLAGGHLYLPIEPSPQLLAQPDPWDPKVDDSLKLFDAVLYHRRYYLYHGVGPAVMLFAPFRLLTHRDLPENFALFLFCLGGFLFAAGSMLTVLECAAVRPGAAMLTAMLLALGICQGVPFLLSRVWVYELAVGGGYFCLSGAVFFLARSWLTNRLAWLPASGLMFGAAVACRPHLGIAGGVILALIACTASRRRLAVFALPFVLVILGIALYNYERFGNPAEFGTKWQLAGENQGRVKLSPKNTLPGLYYLVLARPDFSPVFPWIELPWPPREFVRPPEYFVEQTVGALYLAPFLIGLPLVFRTGRNRGLLVSLALSALGILLFVTMTGWSTQRYEVDFLPLMTLAALAAFAEVTAGASRPLRHVLCGLLAGLIAFGCVVNLALGISGPYWEMIRNKPLRFVRIARWFSPVERHRPVLNHRLDVSFTATVAAAPDHLRQPWITAARFPYRYELYLEHVSGRPTLFSSYAGSVVTRDMEGTGQAAYRVTYSPESGEIQVTRNGEAFLRHPIGPFVTAPSQVLVTVRPEAPTRDGLPRDGRYSR